MKFVSAFASFLSICAFSRAVVLLQGAVRCGQRKPGLVVPWLVTFTKDGGIGGENDNNSSCVGTFISQADENPRESRFIITTRECAQWIDQCKLAAIFSNGAKKDVKSIHCPLLTNPACLVRLKRAVQFQVDVVQPICLPESADFAVHGFTVPNDEMHSSSVKVSGPITPAAIAKQTDCSFNHHDPPPPSNSGRRSSNSILPDSSVMFCAKTGYPYIKEGAPFYGEGPYGYTLLGVHYGQGESHGAFEQQYSEEDDDEDRILAHSHHHHRNNDNYYHVFIRALDFVNAIRNIK